MDADGYLSGYDWVKIFISKILQITHSQWIFRNMTLHDRNGGELRRREAQKLRSEAERFAHMNPMDLKEQDRWLLELDGGKYIKGDGRYIDKCYVIVAARAAIRVGSRRVKYRRHKNTDRKKYSSASATRRQQKRASDDFKVPSVVTVRNVRRKKQVVSGASRMANLKSNKSYLPGD